jgi:hypothetical protein
VATPHGCHIAYMAVINWCSYWLSSTGVHTGCHQLLFILAVINCCSYWLSSTAVHAGCHQLVFILAVINCCSCWLSSTAVHTGCHQLVFILAVINCCSCWLSSTAVHTGCHQLVFMLDVINCCSYWLSSIWCFDCKIALRKVLRPTEACAASWPAFSPCRSASLWYRDASCNATVCCCRAAGSSLHSRVSEGLHGPWPQGLGFRV